jgi:D-aminopeptidase
MFLGMHAASGSEGFLAHTLTSRIARLEVNHRLLAEIELFAASLAPWGIRPIFFSGCPVACQQAEAAIDHIDCFRIDKSGGAKNFDARIWRSKLARAAVRSLENHKTVPYAPAGPFDATVTWREGKAAAAQLARRWKLAHQDKRIFIHAADIHELYRQLIKLCYLTPAVTKILPLALMAFNFWGYIGIWRARRRLIRWGAFA